MAKLQFKSGKRGRPLTIDPELTLNELYEALPRAKKALAEFRKTTSGIREEALLGTNTSLPGWLELSFEALESMPRNKLTYDIAKEIKQTLKVTKRLASRRQDVSTTALEEKITQDYLEDLQEYSRLTNGYAKQKIEALAERIKATPKKQRIAFYKSNKYQDIGTFGRKEYRKIKAWAESSTGRKMTYKEAYAYLITERADRGLETADDIKIMAGGNW